MNSRFAVLFLLGSSSLLAQIAGDVIGQHDLSPNGSSPVKGSLSGSCLYCHAPHSGLATGRALWNQTLSTQTYTPYISSTYLDVGNSQPAPGSASNLCLSCHDGTVAPGQTIAYKQVSISGTMNSADVFGTNLQNSHPFSLVLPIKDSPHLVATLASQGTTADPTGAVTLLKGNIECTSCHDPHVQGKDPANLNFLVRDSSNGQMCLACHDSNRVTTGSSNPLLQWTTSIHALATNRAASQPNVGAYATVSQNSCSSCHAMHNAAGSVRLLRGANEQDCLTCHSGGTNLSPAAPNVLAEFAKTAHPFPSGTAMHDAAEPAVLNQNRHATCVDCHNPHSAMQTLTFAAAPGIRASQNNVLGVSAVDGISSLQPAVNQYENCLRCHGTSTGKTADARYGYLPVRAVVAPDPLNVNLEFAATATSSHPVTHARQSVYPQPSLRPQMVNLDGSLQGRSIGTQILCTDCHNSDDNREFGGSGPNGPHGSKWTHILERRYEFTQAPTLGAAVLNLFPNPDLTQNGPYALCAKCHDLSMVVSNTSFTQHGRHINDGFSCSVCHTAHGMGAQAAAISGERLVNFDTKVVAPNGSAPISYNRAANSCALTCHGHQH